MRKLEYDTLPHAMVLQFSILGPSFFFGVHDVGLLEAETLQNLNPNVSCSFAESTHLQKVEVFEIKIFQILV